MCGADEIQSGSTLESLCNELDVMKKSSKKAQHTPELMDKKKSS